ncbi:MAG: glycosyltransferase, partial [Caulobacteraceae bacterium]
MERDAILTSNRTEAPAGHSPEVSVVVPHFHDLVGLALCLSSLHAQSWPRERFEIIVADNDSPEGQEAVEGVIAGRARLVLVKERGAGPARNGGAAAAGGEILAFTDSDCRADPRWLETGTAALASYDIVGGAMQVLTEDPRCLSPVESYERIFAFNNRRYIRRKGFTVTANLFCSRRVFESIGDFSSDVVSEDVEWCDRARRLGYRIGYAEAAVVSHPARRNWQELVVKWRRLNQESFGLMSRRRGGRWLWVARSLALPLSSFIHTPLALLSPRAPRLDQRLSAAGVLHRLRWWRLRDSLGLLLSPPNHPAGRANSQVGARPTKADPGDPPGAKLLPPVAPRRRASVSLPLVSVIIPHFGDLAGLALCLDALEAQTWPADRVEIIVADNASPEGLPAVERVVAGRARLVLIEERG